MVGSESLLAIENWHDLHAVFGQKSRALAGFPSDGLRGPQALLSEPGLWPDQLVVMSLGRVGTERGPDLEHLRAVVGSGRGRAVHAAGGVRNVGDLEAVAAAGARGALAATALHSGAITQNEIAALLRRRRSET